MNRTCVFPYITLLHVPGSLHLQDQFVEVFAGTNHI